MMTWTPESGDAQAEGQCTQWTGVPGALAKAPPPHTAPRRGCRLPDPWAGVSQLWSPDHIRTQEGEKPARQGLTLGSCPRGTTGHI